MITNRIITRRATAAVVWLTAGVLAAMPAAAQKKAEEWVEVKSPHFTVFSNAGEKKARQVADEFEQFRAVFKRAMNNAEVDPGEPLIIFALKNEASIKALLPQYWEDKKSMRPGGFFASRQEKHYLLARTDIFGDRKYHVLYHEYVHLMTRLNFRSLPVWLSEGLAEFWANATLKGRVVTLGEPDPHHLMNLQQRRMLPLEGLFRATHNSPFYNERDKSSVFYSQSWALVHYFMVSDQMRAKGLLVQYLKLLGTGMEEGQAAQEAFGDLKQLESALQRYVRQQMYKQLATKPVDDVDEKTFKARRMSQGESAAYRGEFLAQMGRRVEARALLAEAMEVEPESAVVQEAMGIVKMREGDREAAMEHYKKAVELGSNSFLVHYYAATMGSPDFENEDWAEEKEKQLRKVIALNPAFAPAHASLAGMLAQQDGKEEEAVKSALQATQLDPGQLLYRMNYARVLMTAGKFGEAKTVASQMMADAKSETESQIARRMLESVENYEEMAARGGQRIRMGSPGGRREEAARVKAEEEEEEEEEEKSEGPPRVQPRQPPPAIVGGPRAAPGVAEGEKKEAGAPVVARAAPVSSGPPLVEAEGKIVSAKCAGAAGLEVRLDFGGYVITLKAADYKKVEVVGAGAGFSVCGGLTGKAVRIFYREEKGAGEIVKIEMVK